MSLPAPPKQLIHHLSNGKTVCFDHRLRRCDICCMDFTYGESDEEDPYAYVFGGRDDLDFGEEDTEDDGEDERVFVLGGCTARFMPQWDEQVLGPANTYKIKKDYDNPPKPLPLPSVQTHHCTICQLTWLVGERGKAAARNHPSHHSYSHEYSGTSRSLLVFTDGACSGNGTRDARGGIGCFFGPSSKFNIGERLPGPQIPTSQKAELTAAARALEIARLQILPARRIMVKEAKGGHDPRAVSDVMHLRLVVVTDSSYLVEGMCRNFANWNENKEGVLINKVGKVVENSAEFLKLRGEVEKLSVVGVQVAYYLVRREENKEADSLAKEASHEVRLGT